MNINNYSEIKPGKKMIKSGYLAIMLWVVGRAIQATARTDKYIKEEFDNLRDDFLVRLWVSPNGPNMFVGKDKNGKVRYMGWNPKGKKATLDMKIKNVEAAMRIFTFKEATAVATTRERFVLNGDLPDACAFVRILNTVETYLLIKVLAKMAIKRYPKWSQMSPIKKHIGRLIIYTRTALGF